jgi:hypothetical protein
VNAKEARLGIAQILTNLTSQLAPILELPVSASFYPCLLAALRAWRGGSVVINFRNFPVIYLAFWLAGSKVRWHENFSVGVVRGVILPFAFVLVPNRPPPAPGFHSSNF